VTRGNRLEPSGRFGSYTEYFHHQYLNPEPTSVAYPFTSLLHTSQEQLKDDLFDLISISFASFFDWLRILSELDAPAGL
jgi:hypothetical protein